MIPPTSIDGTDITGATIDGTDVQEITVDGQTVFSASLDVTQDFEDGNVNDWVGINGTTTSIDSTEVNTGSYAMFVDATLNNNSFENGAYYDAVQLDPNKKYKITCAIYNVAQSRSNGTHGGPAFWSSNQSDGVGLYTNIEENKSEINDIGTSRQSLVGNLSESQAGWANYVIEFDNSTGDIDIEYTDVNNNVVTATATKSFTATYAGIWLFRDTIRVDDWRLEEI